MTSSYGRRTLLRTAGTAVVGVIAGCSDRNSTTEDTSNGETEGPPSVDEFLSETDNYDSIIDETGSDTVTVDVGVKANGAYYGFGPAAIRIDSGTTVTWEWTGKGGTHNVAAQHDADFASEQTSEGGATYKQIFDKPSTVLYVCAPHEGTGMKGAVVVE